MATSMFVKRLLANASCFGLLLLYVMLGGLLFLRFEREQSLRGRDDLIGPKLPPAATAADQQPPQLNGSQKIREL
ncbi:hypothetical protein GPALN_007829 [Globodera pallida]|nr:hypothetical protein GPALN_007829 [Globodera pallida]